MYLLVFFIFCLLFPLLIRCSLRSRLVGAVNREKESRFGSVPFLADVGINSVCLFHSHPFCRQREFALFFCILSITHFSVANLVCPVPEDVCGNTAFAEVCSPARGAASTVTLLSVRTPEFLLCSFYDLARSESLFALPPRIPPSMSIVPPVLCCLCTKSVPFPYTSKPFY